jgi:hypothetical protein
VLKSGVEESLEANCPIEPASGLTGAPGRTLIIPSITTKSSGRSPEVTTRNPFAIGPV